MSIWDRLRTFFQRLPPKASPMLPAASLSSSDARGELREFVYLDEVSVNSLLASRQGALATQHTDRHEVGWKTDGKAKGSLEVPLTGKAELETAVGRASNRSTQVVRNEIVQAAFKKLVESENDDLLIRGGIERFGKQWVDGDSGKKLPSSRLARGQLVELDVELDVEPVYRVSAVFSALVGLVESNPTLLREVAEEGFSEGRAVSEVLRSLLGGLVPIRARVEGYEVTVDADGEEALVPKIAGAINTKPLFLVGVAEEKLFWKDIRRVLFSKGQYRVLARVAQTGTLKTWSPVKLGQILEAVVPDFAQTLNQTSQTVLARTSGPRIQSPAKAMLAPKLRHFVRRYIEAHARTSRPEDFDAVLSKYSAAEYDLTAFRDASYELVRAIPVVPLPDNEAIAQLRTQATKDDDAGVQAVVEVPNDDRYLDCEIIGIYW